MHHVGSSGTLHERMCRKILNAHVFKMAGKITRFLSSKPGKNHKTKNHPTICQKSLQQLDSFSRLVLHYTHLMGLTPKLRANFTRTLKRSAAIVKDRN